MNRLILVAGCHRSGTSAIAAGIAALGVSIPGTPIPPGYGNPKSYSESIEGLRINEEILHAANATWVSLDFDLRNVYQSPEWAGLKFRINQFLQTAFQANPSNLCKDPRLAWLAPLWADEAKHLGVAVSIVAAIRHPVASATSMHKRDRMPLDFAFALWQAYITRLLQNHIDLVVDYDTLMANPAHQLNRIEHLLNLPPSDPEKVDDFCFDFLDPNLQRNSVPATATTTDSTINTLWEQLYKRAQT